MHLFRWSSIFRFFYDIQNSLSKKSRYFHDRSNFLPNYNHDRICRRNYEADKKNCHENSYKLVTFLIVSSWNYQDYGTHKHVQKSLPHQYSNSENCFSESHGVVLDHQMTTTEPPLNSIFLILFELLKRPIRIQNPA